MSQVLSRDPRDSPYWCYCNIINSPHPYMYEHHMFVVREIHNSHSWTDYESVHEVHKDINNVSWSKLLNNQQPLDESWTPVHRYVFEEMKQQFLTNIAMRHMKPFQETETVFRNEKGILFYKPVENQ